MAEKDELVDLNPAQHNPYEAKPSDFPKSGGGKEAEGKDQLVSLGENQCGPRHEQDGGKGSSGYGTPSDWGKGGTGFKVGRSTAEEGTNAGSENSIDLITGKISVSGYSATRVDEVADKNVRIPSR